MPEPYETWNRIFTKASKQGEAALTTVERTIYLANRFVIDLELGGLTGALYNASHVLRPTADALQAIGERTAATIVREAADLLEPLLQRRFHTWKALLDAAHLTERLEPWDKRLTAKSEAMYSKLERFTTKHYQ